MPAHQPRRSFAAPFVITLAAGPSCAPQPLTANPPEVIGSVPPTSTETPPVETPPADPSQPRRWSLTETGGTCHTQLATDCSAPPCAPAPTVAYACPTWDDGSRMGLENARIEREAGETTCVLYQNPSCSPDATCNPPPPRAVPCPKS
jgi:hypothetical protein